MSYIAKLLRAYEVKQQAKQHRSGRDEILAVLGKESPLARPATGAWGTALGRLAQAALLVAGCSFSGVTPVKAETYLYGSFLPPTHQGVKRMEGFFADVSAQSETMDWDVFIGGSVGGPRDILGGVRDQIIHSGHIVDVFTPSDLPVSNVIAQLSMIVGDTLAATAAANETFLLNCPACKAEMANHSVLPLVYYATSPQVLMCNAKISGLADLEGRRVRSVGPIGSAYQALGAVPVNTAVTELYDALQRGQVDCASASEAWLKDFRLMEVAEFVYAFPVATYPSSQPLNINLETWDGLSDADKDILTADLGQLAADWAYVYLDEEAAARELASEQGLTYLGMPQDIRDAIISYREGEAERVIAWGKERGVEDAEGIVTSFLSALERWEARVADIGEDRAAFAAALEADVFSKVSY